MLKKVLGSVSHIRKIQSFVSYHKMSILSLDHIREKVQSCGLYFQKISSILWVTLEKNQFFQSFGEKDVQFYESFGEKGVQFCESY